MDPRSSDKSKWVLSRFHSHDDPSALRQLVLDAWTEFQPQYLDWEVSKRSLLNMPSLAEDGEIILAKSDTTLLGAVAYMPPHTTRRDYFKPGWALIRMLVVHPGARGQGIGRALTQACLDRASENGDQIIALHTSSMMEHALALYLDMGFVRVSAAPSDTRYPYSVYIKEVMPLALGES